MPRPSLIRKCNKPNAPAVAEAYLVDPAIYTWDPAAPILVREGVIPGAAVAIAVSVRILIWAV
jgi:hypothetical protein